MITASERPKPSEMSKDEMAHLLVTEYGKLLNQLPFYFVDTLDNYAAEVYYRYYNALDEFEEMVDYRENNEFEQV